MDLNEVRSLLTQLTELVGGWNVSDEISAIERDLALEKLRRLYDAVAFGGVRAVEKPAETQTTAETALPEVAVPIDLGEVLSLDVAVDVFPGNDAAVVFDLPSDAAAMEETSDGAEPAVEEPAAASPEPGSHAPVSDQPAASEPERESESQPEPVCAEQPAAESQPLSATVPQTGAARAAYAAPTLFGPEDETVRHRHKQRVIMSLYGPEPSVSVVASESGRKSPAENSQPLFGAASSEKPVQENVVADASEAVSAPAVAKDALAEQTSVSASESAPAPKPVSTSEPAPVPEPVSASEPAPAPESVAVPAAVFASAPASRPEQDSMPAVGAVLGEVINHDVQTLADTIAPPRDVAEQLRRSEPVTDLQKAVGINDKFLMIRDLFGGDAAAYEAAMETLNEFQDLDDCMIYIAEHYAWNANSDGAKLLMDLLERKFA